MKQGLFYATSPHVKKQKIFLNKTTCVLFNLYNLLGQQSSPLPAGEIRYPNLKQRKENKMTTNEKVTDLLTDLSGLSDISPESTLNEDLGLDSLAMVMLLVALEDTFAIELNEADMNPFDLKTVGDVISLAERYVDDHEDAH